MLKCVSALPRLERFASEVCDITLRLGAAFLPTEARGASLTGKDAPTVVPKVLRGWLQSLQLLTDYSDLFVAVQSELDRRPGGGVPRLPNSEAIPTHGLCLQAVRQLVDVERAALGTQETLKAAEGLVASQPDVLVHRIVHHFMHLFDCARMEGVLPRMNQVYVGLNEAKNFQRSLALLLGFAEGSGARRAPLAEPPSLQQLSETVRRLVQMGLGLDKTLLQSLHEGNGTAGAAAGSGRKDGGPRVPAPGGGPMVAVVLRNGDVVWEGKKEADFVPLVFGSAAEAEAVAAAATVATAATSSGEGPGAEDAAEAEAGADAQTMPSSAVVAAAGHTGSAAADAPVVRAAETETAAYVQAMQAVLALLQVENLQEALAQLERVVRRLDRLDEALPRYQRLAQRLYDVLRVSALEEIVPAVERIMRTVG